MTWTETWLERGVGYGRGKNGDKNAYNLKMTVDSVCDTDVAVAPNLRLPLSHFYPPLKCRALSVPSVLAKPVRHAVDFHGKVRLYRKQIYILVFGFSLFIRFKHGIGQIIYLYYYCTLSCYKMWLLMFLLTM